MRQITLTDFCLILFLTLLGAVAQICLKKGARPETGRAAIAALFNPWTLGGGVLIVVDTIGMVFMLRFLSLVYVVPLMALHYVFVPLGAVLVFHERVHWTFWLGAGIIVCGVSVITLFAQ